MESETIRLTMKNLIWEKVSHGHGSANNGCRILSHFGGRRQWLPFWIWVIR